MIREQCGRRCDTCRLFGEEAKLRHHTPEMEIIGGAGDEIGPGNMQVEQKQDLVQLGQGCGHAPPTEQ